LAKKVIKFWSTAGNYTVSGKKSKPLDIVKYKC